MKWEKFKVGDRWVLMSPPDTQGVRKPLGSVERVGLRYEARDGAGIVISNGCIRQHAMLSVEKSA
jgi:hypothetical protein